jgi:N-acetylglutamate synthase-like GNAT family acetyltransferase
MSKLEKVCVSRKPQLADIPSIAEIYKQNPNYDLEVFKNVLDDIVVVDALDHDQIVSYGALKQFIEAVVTIDQTRSKKEKLIAIKQMLDAAIDKCNEHDIPDLHMFTEDEKFAQLLINKFGFEKINGIALVKDLRQLNNKG